MSNPAKSIRIGTMISASGGKAAARIGEIADLGFESFEPFFWQTTNGQDLAELGKRSLDAIGDRGPRAVSVGRVEQADRPRRDERVADDIADHERPRWRRFIAADRHQFHLRMDQQQAQQFHAGVSTGSYDGGFDALHGRNAIS